jgi:hypothetical protein
MTIKPQRKKRFQRDPSVRLRLTERDLSIIHEVYKHRFLTSEQITALSPGSPQKLLRRLSLLYHAGYLDRPPAQLARRGNFPLVYGLGNQGAEFLAYQLDIPATSVDWTSKNREVKGVFLEHTLMVSQFLVTMRLACKRVRGVRFIDQETIINLRPSVPAGVGRALSWQVELKGEYPAYKRNTALTLIPDSIFALNYHENGQDTGRAYFFVEVDRSTMPIKRSDLRKSSFYKKMVGYWDSWQQGLFSQEFPFKKARILTLVLSAERARSMIAINKELDSRGKGLRMFLFGPAAISDLKEPEVVFSRSWRNGREEAASLLD